MTLGTIWVSKLCLGIIMDTAKLLKPKLPGHVLAVKQAENPHVQHASNPCGKKQKKKSKNTNK